MRESACTMNRISLLRFTVTAGKDDLFKIVKMFLMEMKKK